MAEKGYESLKMARNDLKWLNMAKNSNKLLLIATKGWHWLEMFDNGCPMALTR